VLVIWNLFSRKLQTKLNLKLHLVLYLFAFIGYCRLSYFTLRSNAYEVILLYTLLFAIYFLLLKIVKTPSAIKIAIGAAILFRFGLLFSIPNLSDDFYRFIWDGQLVIDHISPYQYLPSQWVSPDPSVGTIYQNLNSPHYLSVYPPVCQYIFAFAYLLFTDNILGNIIIMKAFIFLFEVFC